MKINYLIIPAKRLRELISGKTVIKMSKRDVYKFFIWVDDKGKRAFDFTERDKEIEFSDFLDNWDIPKHNQYL